MNTTTDKDGHLHYILPMDKNLYPFLIIHSPLWEKTANCFVCVLLNNRDDIGKANVFVNKYWLFAFHLNKSAVTLIFKPLHFDDNGITGPDWGHSELV